MIRTPPKPAAANPPEDIRNDPGTKALRTDKHGLAKAPISEQGTKAMSKVKEDLRGSSGLKFGQPLMGITHELECRIYDTPIERIIGKHHKAAEACTCPAYDNLREDGSKIGEPQKAPPHEERVRTEREELNDKIDKLRKFTQSDTYAGLNDVDRYLLTEQYQHMSRYRSVLDLRISRFNED